MYIVISTYRAKVGEEDAIVALHEDWQRHQARKTRNYLSWELLRNVDTPRVFMTITHYRNKESALAAADDLAQDDWYPRLISLLEEAPTSTDYQREWVALS